MLYDRFLSKKQELDAIMGENNIPVEQNLQRMLTLVQLLIREYSHEIKIASKGEKKLWINAKKQFIQTIEALYTGYIETAPDQKNFWEKQKAKLK